MNVSLNKKQLVQTITTDLNNLFHLLDKKGVLTVSELKKINNRMIKLCTKQLQKRDKASQKVYKMLDCTSLALDMCRFLDVEDTSIFSRDLIRDEFIDKIIHYRKNMELLHNREVEETGVGFKSYLYQNIETEKTEECIEK